ncbi:E3 ubiquitin-protein ligase UBR2 [Larimichthys crocea]|uniref:E3 ubiquitin-protein ligase n=1 Tax=Larimichthys crocea TaxID=215358 RepID=A0A6G0HNX1_LARCR|nr:E3 ubiquitin-protein ligase UBR2 [Larimichthys crocea]
MDEDSVGSEEEELTCQLYNTLRENLGSVLPEVTSGWQLVRCVKVGILPFLRAAAIFFHYLNSTAPPADLLVTGPGQWEALCSYLSLPSNLLQLHQNQHTLLEPLIHRWCCHPGVRQVLQGGGVIVRFPRESNRLIELPEDYSVLINQASSVTCPRSGGDKSRAPTLCLVCGSMLCSQSYCCQTEVDGEDVGACTAHTFTCGAGLGLFLRVRESQVLFVAGKTKGCFYPPPYLDDYGETDQGLKRGNPSTFVLSVTGRLSVCGVSTASLRSSVTLRRPIRRWSPSTGSTCDVWLRPHSQTRLMIGSLPHLPFNTTSSQPISFLQPSAEPISFQGFFQDFLVFV